MTNVLALKYRPHTFEEIIGQADVVKQLRTALNTNTLGHSLIFCGTRGSGKTTTARIIAKELNKNFLNTEDENAWEKLSPLVVMEIDAASNNGVDDIRQIIEDVRYTVPGHRVVIFDESHMITRNAFNSLLKLLEEPPSNVTFLLLTTEPHKLIPTIVSRCQKYEFKDVSVEILTDYYKSIVVKENLEKVIPIEIIQKIALQAEGSIRDGLTILQKYVGGVEIEDYQKEYFDLVGAIYNEDVTTALSLVNSISKTEEARLIIQTLEKWFYYCSLENFGILTPVREFFSESPLNLDTHLLQSLFNICLEIDKSFYATPNSKAILQMGIIKLTMRHGLKNTNV